MNANKIEIYWNLIPNEYNQFEDKNEFGYRVKSKDFDYVVNGIYIDKNKINNFQAMKTIARDLNSTLHRPFYFYPNYMESEEE